MKISATKILRYTIVEMMMVIAVFMIILSMAIASWISSGNQAKLKNAARLVSGQLNLAKAKAATSREPVRLVFTSANNTTKIEMFYGESGSDKPLDVDPVYLPGGILFAADRGENASGEPEKYTDNTSVSRTNPSAIVFAATGKLKSNDTNKRFYLVEECPDGKIKSDQVYYIITVNQFTGRINTTLETVK